MMKLNTGLVSVGHILAKDQKDHLRALKGFCAVMLANMGKEMVSKNSAFALFDKFMSSTKANLENFSTLAMGVLMKHGIDQLEFQLKVELLAWDIVKHAYERLFNDDILTEEISFKLFGLFNRFCDPHILPLAISSKAFVYLCQRFEFKNYQIATDDDDEDKTFDFWDLLKLSKSNMSLAVAAKISKVHDKLVNFVIIEDSLRYKLIQDGGSLTSWLSLTATPAPPKKIVVDYRHLKICNPNNSEEVLHKIPLMDAIVRIKSASKSLFKRHSSTLVILSTEVVEGRNRSTTLELTFDAFRDAYKMYKWSEAVTQAAEMSSNGTNPLAQVYQTHDIAGAKRRLKNSVKSEIMPAKILFTAKSQPRFVRESTPQPEKFGPRSQRREDETQHLQRRQSAPSLEPGSCEESVLNRDDSFSDSGVSCNSSVSDFEHKDKNHRMRMAQQQQMMKMTQV